MLLSATAEPEVAGHGGSREQDGNMCATHAGAQTEEEPQAAEARGALATNNTHTHTYTHARTHAHSYVLVQNPAPQGR